jgi:hypothetical protein
MGSQWLVDLKREPSQRHETFRAAAAAYDRLGIIWIDGVAWTICV